MTYEKHYDEITGELVAIKGTQEDGTVIYIPIDEGNKDYRAYLTTL